MAANLEQLAVHIAGLDRPGLLDYLETLRCTFELDFTAEFLRSLPVDQLRHIALAASLHRRLEP
ncbi:MAG: hypothetical protein ACLFUJ_05030 [Phycisphaerae bacterium]